MMTMDQHFGTDWAVYQGDCVQTLQGLPDSSVHLTISSPPFSNLYIYSDSLADMGNSKDHEEFFAHMDYLIAELLRVTKPGRLCCMHCKDLPLYMSRDDTAGLYDFPGDLVRHFVEGGWTFHSRITIWKDPVTEMQRTKNHGLLHKNFAVRSEVCRQGMADYVLVFRAWKGEIPDKQIAHTPTPGAFIGEQPPTHWRNERDYSIQVWQRYASPVWFDINQQRVLPYAQARGNDDERHLCPLQMDVIERCLWLWSNAGEVILDPFSGIGSVGYCALQQQRRFIGCELKADYVRVSIQMLESALAERQQLALI
jgi:DNA modification methylase